TIWCFTSAVSRDAPSGGRFSWINAEICNQFAQILFLNEPGGILRPEPAAGTLLAFGPFVGHLIDFQREDVHFAAPFHARRQHLAVIETPDLAARDRTGNARLLSGFASGGFLGFFALLRPALGQDPAASATAGDQHDLETAVLGPAPGQGGHLHTARHAAEEAANALRQLLACTVADDHRPKIPADSFAVSKISLAII